MGIDRQITLVTVEITAGCRWKRRERLPQGSRAQVRTSPCGRGAVTDMGVH